MAAYAKLSRLFISINKERNFLKKKRRLKIKFKKNCGPVDCGMLGNKWGKGYLKINIIEIVGSYSRRILEN